MQNLSFLHSLEVAQKFVVEEPKIILRSQRLYGVERDFSDQLKPKPSWTINAWERNGKNIQTNNSLRWGNLLRRVQWKKIYEILKYCCCATKNEFNNTAWAQGFKKYLWASLFLHNLRVLVTFMIMSRRNVLLFFGIAFGNTMKYCVFQS